MKLFEFIVFAILLIADQGTKLLVSSKMTLFQSIPVIGNFLKITYVHNTGAAWSMFSGGRWVFVAMALLVCLGLEIYLLKNRNEKKFIRFIIVLIIAGAMGNVIDRIRFGYVIDFIDTYPFGYDFPVFNIADCCLTVSGILLGLTVLLERDK